MQGSHVRDLDQIEEATPGRGGGNLGALVLASLGGACLVFAAAVLFHTPTSPAGAKAPDPLDALLARVPAASSSSRATAPRDLTTQDVTFPGLLSDESRPTTALAALRTNTSAPASAVSAHAPSVEPPLPPWNAPGVTGVTPPVASDRLPVMPLPAAQQALGASPVVTNPRDPLTVRVKEASTPTEGHSNLAEEGHPGPFLLQVSSFRSDAEAKAFATLLRQRGHRAYVESAQLPGRGAWYRVRIGPFSSSHEALVYRSEFERKERLVPFLVEPEKEKRLADAREAERRTRESLRR